MLPTLAFLVGLLFVTGSSVEGLCGYESCPKPKAGFVNLHFIPHTHDDVGWLKTVDQYYYGNRNDIQDAGVQYILDSVIHALLANPSRRFIYVETAFFWKWWEQQSNVTRGNVHLLVNNGQLEFISGGWSMPDEATAYYQAIIDDFTWGFRKLSDAFGTCGHPRVGWQIDPFGHSRESAAIMARMGFDGLFFGRIDYQDKDRRMKAKEAEMLWHTSANDLSKNADLFTSVMYNTYQAPDNFCFDVNCHDEPIVDDVKSTEYNAPDRASEFLTTMRDYAMSYRTNNVLVTMGGDFMYMDASMNFKNMDKLITHINEKQSNGSLFNAFYSTPSCYLKAVHDTDVVLPTKQDDFFPYSSDPFAYWTGYFTSRPTLKYFERKGNNFLQVCKQLHTLSRLSSKELDKLTNMREAVAILQHHDAITGTEQQHVANDYARILNEGFNSCATVTNEAFNKLMPKTGLRINTYSCVGQNISSCSISEDNDNFVVTVYNPLARKVNYTVRLPVPSNNSFYSVLCPKGYKQTVQIVSIPDSVLNIPGRISKAKAELVFVAKHLPPLGFRSYYISRTKQTKKTVVEIKLAGKSINLGYENGGSITVNANGSITGISMFGKKSSFDQKFYYYNSAVGNNEVFKNRSSGAYIFRPNGSAISIGLPQQVKIIKGHLVTEIQQQFNEWVSQIVRVFSSSPYVEFQWLVGPIPISEVGKEVVTRYTNPSIKNDNEFYTDSNGREYIRRTLNHRDTWNVSLAESVPGNYYPLTTTISIEDSFKRVSAVVDRAEGGTSLNSGQIELMVHRRLTHDDAFGVGEALNETAYGVGLVARGSHYITTGSKAQVRMLAQEKVLDSWVFLTPANDLSFFEWKNSYEMEYSGLTAPLPDNIHILTLEPWSSHSYLLRLEHIMENADDPKLSQPVSIQIQKIFAELPVVEIHEMLLGANRKARDYKRLIWKRSGEQEQENRKYPPNQQGTITIAPMQIRTFLIHYHKALFQI